MRKLAVLFALLGSLFVVSAAQAAPPTSVFDGTIACTTQGPGPAEGQTWCGTGQHNQNANVRSTVESFDGVPIDVNVPSRMKASSARLRTRWSTCSTDTAAARSTSPA
ncbi:MAG: hypothetical protein KDB57_06935 [Solirubrobacterales bacterium]|nr:hypothetical protein [Solirubrobacterales bacterium]